MAISGSLIGSIAAGAAIGMATSAGTAAIRGGKFKDILKSGLIGGGIGATGGAIGGAFSSGAIGNAVSNMGQAVAKVGTEGSKLASISGKIGQGLITFGSKIGGNAATTATNALAEKPDAVTIAEAAKDPILPNGPSLRPKIGPDTKVTTKALTQGNTTATAPTAGGSTTTNAVSAPVPGNTASSTTTTTTTTPTSASAPKTLLNKIGTGIKNNVGKVGGQIVVQGLFSLASAGMAAKSAKEANRVSQQSLLFQQQTYRDQRADQQRKDTQLKSDAWNAYQSVNILGEKLYSQGTNSLLFTKDFKTNPTGNYSVLSGNSPSFADSELSLTKYTDLT